MVRTLVIRSTVLLLAAGASLPALAQAIHVMAMHGKVSVHREGAAAPVAAAVNAPLLAGDRLVTGKRSRAEVWIDPAHSLRLDSNAEIDLAHVEGGSYQMRLAKGVVDYSVHGPSAANVAVDTPSVSVVPAREGAYRIALKGDGHSEIVAWTGAIQVRAPAGSEWVNAGQKMIARGPAANPEFRIVRAFSRWRQVATILANSLQVMADVASDTASATSSSSDSGSSKTSSSGSSPRSSSSESRGASSPSPPPSAAGKGK